MEVLSFVLNVVVVSSAGVEGFSRVSFLEPSYRPTLFGDPPSSRDSLVQNSRFGR